jgi:predicted TIM-barrel fold metal-dependent hydrolase
MSIFDEPKFDCHVHVLDPTRFPYDPASRYQPQGQEIGTRAQMVQLFDAYGVHGALIVGPNSGYGTDNRCTLDAIKRSDGAWTGIAVVETTAAIDQLANLQSQGIVGIAINATFHPIEVYRDIRSLIRHLTELGMFLQIQVEGDQLVELMPQLEASRVRLLFDHCGRPVPENGLDQPGFKALRRLGETGRAAVKLSGYSKFSRQAHPHDDVVPYVQALITSFGVENCLWASDWPHLRAPERIDYGVLLKLAEQLLPDPAVRRRIMWDNPRRLFDFVNV